MTAADEFFGIMNVTTTTITRGESAIRDATRGATRKVTTRKVTTRKKNTRAMQQPSRRRDKGKGFTTTQGRQRDIATPTYIKGNETMFNSFQL